MPKPGGATAALATALRLPVFDKGWVWLAGAGPGDPGLITALGAYAIQNADVILYDALIDTALLTLARPGAELVFAGKRAGVKSCKQSDISRTLVSLAKKGKRVLRLKGGDPFVFGRGGEEVLALARAGVPFEIIPGLTTAVAAPALAGIPVTHRGLASSFAVITGHHEATYAPLLDGLPPDSLTLVVLMGLGQRARIADRLLARGWSRETPAAVIVGAATPRSWQWTGTLGVLGAAEIPAASAGAPGLLVIGAVVGLAAELAADLSSDLASDLASDAPMRRNEKGES